jgi:hypothetical protein
MTERRARAVEGPLVLAAYAGLLAVWWITGARPQVPLSNWQYLPWPDLLDDLGRSLVDLHAQPPLMNLLLGLGLKLWRSAGIPVEAFFLAMQSLAGGLAVCAIWRVAADLVPLRPVRLAAMGFVLLNPFLYVSVFLAFYTLWEMFFLALVALGAHRYFEKPSPKRLAASIAPAFLLVHVRSLFHVAWLALLATALLGLAWTRLGAVRRQAVAVASASLLLACAWPAKNLLRFGFFGSSSWQGFNVARGLPVDPPAALPVFYRGDREPIDPRLASLAAGLVPPGLRDRPALAQLAKPDGAPNWNHYAMLVVSRRMGEDAAALLRREPWLLGYKALDFYLDGYAVFEGRHSYSGDYIPQLEPGRQWARVYEAVAFQPFRPFDPAVTRLSTGFAIVFPLALCGIVYLLVRRRQRWAVAERTVLMMLLSVGWVLLLVLGVDGAEGNRVRYPTGFLFLLSAGWALSAVLGRREGPPPP